MPHLKAEIFTLEDTQKLIDYINKFAEKYEEFPTFADLKHFIDDVDVLAVLRNVQDVRLEDYNDKFLNDDVEAYFKRKLVYNGAMAVLDDVQSGELENVGSSVSDLALADAFTFDKDMGLSVFSDVDALYDELHIRDEFIPTGLVSIDNMTGGGAGKETLSLILAETNLGKSLILGALACNFCMSGYKVLYITLEMARRKVAGRILRNALDISSKELYSLDKASLGLRIQGVQEQINRTLRIKEYPPDFANVSHFRNFIQEYKSMYGESFDVVIVDYLQLMLPHRNLYRANSNDQMDVISKELRGLSVTEKIPVYSAYQTNRGGMGMSEIDLTNSSSGISTAFNADNIWGVTQTEEQKDNGLYMWQLLKARDSGHKGVKVPIGVDYEKMRLYDVDDQYTANQQASKLVREVESGVGAVMGKLTANGSSLNSAGVGAIMDDDEDDGISW